MLNTSTDSTTFIGADALARGHKQFAQLNRGIVAHRLGRLGEARRIFESVVKDHPEDIDALQLLSVVYLANADYEDAHDVLRRLISLGGESALIYHNLGNVLCELQRPEDAVVFYEKAAKLDPNDFDLLKNHGVTLAELGRFEEALACYEAALSTKLDPEVLNSCGALLVRMERPEDGLDYFREAMRLEPFCFNAIYNLSGALQRLGQLDEAAILIRKALEKKPSSAAALTRLGEVLLEQKKYQEALAVFTKLKNEQPDNFDAQIALGRIWFELHDFGKALDAFDGAIRLNSRNARAFYNKGKTLAALECKEQAVEAYEQSIYLDPDAHHAYTNLGNLLRELGRLEDALNLHRIACDLDPSSPRPKNNIALVMKELGHLDAALESYDEALALDPDSVDVNWNKSLLLLLQGNYEEGWPLYEWRLKREDTLQEYPQFAQPSWRGETDLRGQRLLVHLEQGLGDMVQFCRYIPILVDKGIEVILQVQTSLLPLIASLESDVTLVSQDDPLPDFDAYCPLMSLPYALGTTLETIPSSDSYLSPCPEKVAEWREKLGSADALRVGLAWSGRKEHKNDHNRSMALANLLPVLDVPVEWHSIQKDYRSVDLDVLKTLPQLYQHQRDLNDFSDTAALLANLDLVITVDTSVAHVAAALGKPTWLLLPYLSDFRWLMDRVDTPWYPSMRLYRQDQPNDWTPVLQRIKNDLDNNFELISTATSELYFQQRTAGAKIASIETQPSEISKMLTKAIALHESGDGASAESLCIKVMEYEQDNFDATQLLGALLLGRKHYECALALFEKAEKIDERQAILFVNKGIALKALGRVEDALLSYNRALEIDEKNADAYYNKGNLFRLLGRQEEARSSYEISCSLSPKNSLSFYNLGNCYRELGHLDAALESYDEALALDPDSVDVNWNKSLLLLLQGNYEEGWPLYEWRLKREDTLQEYPQFAQPSWRGETDLRGQRLLVHLEQGLGDMVQFCRYIPILVDKGIEVILQVQTPLLPLIASLESDVTLVSQDDPLPDFDAYCPLMSLPYALGTTLETIPSSDSYLSPCPEKVAEWREKLGSADALRGWLGLVWS